MGVPGLVITPVQLGVGAQVNAFPVDTRRVVVYLTNICLRSNSRLYESNATISRLLSLFLFSCTITVQHVFKLSAAQGGVPLRLLIKYASASLKPFSLISTLAAFLVTFPLIFRYSEVVEKTPFSYFM